MKTTQETKFYMSLAFGGDFRPFHVEGETVRDCHKQIVAACDHPRLLEMSADGVKSWERQRKAGINVCNASAMHGGLSVTIGEGNRDTWLDSITASFPLCPEIDYSKAERGEG